MEGESTTIRGARLPQKRVFTITDLGKDTKGKWVSIGVGWVNHDASLNLRLDALPVNGRIHVRDWEPLRPRGEQGTGGTATETGGSASPSPVPDAAKF